MYYNIYLDKSYFEGRACYIGKIKAYMYWSKGAALNKAVGC